MNFQRDSWRRCRSSWWMGEGRTVAQLSRSWGIQGQKSLNKLVGGRASNGERPKGGNTSSEPRIEILKYNFLCQVSVWLHLLLLKLYESSNFGGTLSCFCILKMNWDDIYTVKYLNNYFIIKNKERKWKNKAVASHWKPFLILFKVNQWRIEHKGTKKIYIWQKWTPSHPFYALMDPALA